MRKTLLSTLAVVMLLFGASRSSAEEAKPVVIVSVTSVDRLMSNLDKFGEIAESKAFTDIAKAMAANSLRGIDTAKPAGVLVTTDGAGFKSVGFIPVRDFKTVMQTLKGEDAGGGVYEVRLGRGRGYAKSQGDWAFISDNSDALGELPADPIKLLAGQEKEYDVAVRALVQNVPETLREFAMTAIKSGIEQADRLDGESEEEFQTRMKTAKAMIDQMVGVVNDLDHITIGWSLDDTAKKTFVDFNIVAKNGTKTAKNFAVYADTKTNFAGFLLPDAAARYNASYKMSKEDADQTIKALKGLREQMLRQLENEGDFDNDEQRKVVKQAFNNVMDSFEATLSAGEADAAASLVLNPDAVTVIAGARVVKPEKIEASIKDVVEMIKDQPGVPPIKLNAETHAGVRMHTASVPVPDPEAAKVFGDNVDIVIGVGESSIYLAAGRDAMKTLKAAIDKSAAGAKEVPATELNVSLGPIVNFVASLQPDNIIAKMLADQIATHKGKDNVRLTVRPIKNGVSSRVEIEQGVLNLIGKAIPLVAGAAGGAF